MFSGEHVGFGAIYENIKEIDKALAVFDDAVKVEPVSAAFNNRERMYYFIGDLQNVFKDYQKALELMPDNPRGHFNIAGVYLDRKRLLKPFRSCKSRRAWVIRPPSNYSSKSKHKDALSTQTPKISHIGIFCLKIKEPYYTL